MSFIFSFRRLIERLVWLACSPRGHGTIWLIVLYLIPLFHLDSLLLVTSTAGNDPAQSSTVWLDRFFGMGTNTKDLIPQYDCPMESVYLPATTFTVLGNVQRRRAICIFEQDVGKPLTRHYGYQEGETGAVKSYVLTIRTINTLGK